MREKSGKKRISGQTAGLLVLLVLILISLFFTYKYYVSAAADRDRPILVNSYGREDIPDLQQGDVIQQEVELEDTQVDSFSVWLNTTKASADSAVSISLKKASDQSVIASWPDIDTSVHKADQPYQLTLDEPYRVSGPVKLLIEVVMTKQDADGPITLKQSNMDSYVSGNMYLNGEQQEHDLTFYFYSGKATFVKPLFAGLSIFILLIAAGLGYLMKKKVRPEFVFGFLGLTLGLIFMVFWSPYALPDEERHIPTAYYYSNILMGEKPLSEDGRVMVRAEDMKFNNQEEFTRLSTYALMLDHMGRSSSDNTMVPYDKGPLDTDFISYIPQVLGITLARLLNFSCVNLLLMGRLFGLLFYLGCGFAAIRIAPRFKWFLTLFMLLPGILASSAAITYDTVQNALALLYFAWLFRLLYTKAKVRRRDVLVLSVLMFELASTKVIYVLLGLLCLLLPLQTETAGPVKKLLKKWWLLLPTLAGVVSIIVMRLGGVVSYAGTQLSKPEDDLWNVANVLRYPLKFIYVLLHTPVVNLEKWVKELVYGYPSYSGIEFPGSIIWLLLICVAAACLIDPAGKITGTKSRIYIAGICTCLTGALMLVFIFTNYAKITDDYIIGIQGRYFIPFLPWILLVLPAVRQRLKLAENKILLLGAYLTLQTAFIMQLVRTVVGR